MIPPHWVRQRQVLYVVQSHVPLLRLLLRVLLLFTGASLVTWILFRAAGQHLPTSLPWNPFMPEHRTQTEQQQNRARQNNKAVVVVVENKNINEKQEQQILNQDPNYPRVREWVNDHIYYNFYDGTSVFTNQAHVNGDVTRKPLRAETDMFTQVLDKAVAYLENIHPGRYKKQHCYSIRYRTVPTAGLEADVTCRNDKDELDRVSVLLPFTMPRILYHHHQHNNNNSIVLIIPLQGKLDRLKLFLANLWGLLESGEERKVAVELNVCIVYFDDASTTAARQLLHTASQRIPTLNTEFILLQGTEGKDAPFSRGRGLQVGAESTKLRGDVLFFCDVDVLFTSEFLTRCSVTPVKGYQVYLPILFSLYNPSFVYPLYKHKLPSPLDQLHVHDNHGYWRLWGHGMVCVYRSDFLALPGFDKDKKDWGGEDIGFLRQVVHKSSLKVIRLSFLSNDNHHHLLLHTYRSLDPGLFHLYHNKNCDGGKNRANCIKVRARSEASQMSLGLWYFRRTENVSVFGILAEGNELLDQHYDDDNNNNNIHDPSRTRDDSSEHATT
ncbi:hypothetical protein Pcinc_035850 [Petrolisthes cinctipes]|uniref:Hexosyltransferase n=1 Tax=Petrolisthes cinctipes TaxID=88211 RepID=A0AAE1EMX0_PETCI|nr:hypothetical protein Pcinc_035850 [Petrolisthes cinctipes]